MAEIALPTKKHVWEVGDRIKFNRGAHSRVWDHYAIITSVGRHELAYKYERPLPGYPSEETCNPDLNSQFFDYSPPLPDSTDPYSVLKWLESE